MFGIPVATLHAQRYRQTAIGRLAFKVGRHLRWDLADLEAWIEEQKREGRHEESRRA